VSGVGTKVRPAVVVQNDGLNSKLNSTIVAIITSTNARASIEPTQLHIDISTPDGKQSGLLHNSTVKAEHLDTVDQRDIVRRIGHLSVSLLSELDDCMKAALGIARTS
jgi:mRNA interferase MazF